MIANTDEKRLSRIVIVFELPFVVDENDIRKWFSKVGGIKNMEIFRSGALVFSTAIIELQKKSGVKKACELALAEYGNSNNNSNSSGGGGNSDFDIIIMSAVDFLAGKKLPKRNRNGVVVDKSEVEKKSSACKMQ